MILILHIAGGVTSLFIAFFAIVSLVCRKEQNKLYSISLFSLTLLELITGALLVYEGQSSFFSFCAKFAFYMTVVGSTQIALLLNARKVVTSFSSSK